MKLDKLDIMEHKNFSNIGGGVEVTIPQYPCLNPCSF